MLMKAIADQVIMITGATDGLGKAVAFELAQMGATLVLHGRDPEKGALVLKEMREVSGNPYHEYYNADFSSLKEVQELADAVLRNHTSLDILINNAGIGGGEKQFSADGYELRFAVNYLSGFLLTLALLPLLQQSRPSRIINVASGSQQPIDFNDLMLEKNYSGSRAYAQSKLAQVMFTFQLAENLAGTGTTVNCLHPASLMDTKLVRERAAPQTSVEEGADSVIYLATSPEIGHVSGAYFDHREQTRANSQAYDPQARQRLFDLSLKLTGLRAKKLK